MESRPIRLDAGQPQLGQGAQQECVVGLLLVDRAQYRHHKRRHLLAVGWMLFDEGTQTLSSTHLDQHTVLFLQQLAHAIGEAHCLTHVPQPVVGRGDLFLLHPGTGQV